ncbi:hypothetical protein ACIA5G_33600 [Amycolatopsis sp. NPDC051758]|uniref:sunset domain-containing protein n=1 Tax=Amycolatopsis sp. NPDC051758 TaxID=3363935 RepID=UPI0037AE0ACD
MPKWRKPELPDGPLRELNDELHRLHAYSGYRSTYQIAEWLKARAATEPNSLEDWTTPSHTYIHRTLCSPALPNRPTMISVVEAFIELGQIRGGRQVRDKVEMLWTAAFEHRPPALPEHTEAPLLTAETSVATPEELVASGSLIEVAEAVPPTAEATLTGSELFRPSLPATEILGERVSSTAEPTSGRHALREQLPHPESVPPGPCGPRSAMPRPGGGRPSEEFCVKASITALRYCADDNPKFSRMVAELWFINVEDAERVGFRPLP